jgi:gliding motility-associated-like protein
MGPGAPFCTYYVNNSAGATISYDGLTTTLTAIARVTPCDTYHLKLGVADAFDDVYDSGVFLKAGSLTSISFNTTPVGVDPSDTGFGSQFCIRGCTPGYFVFTNTGSLTDSITIHYVIGGTGINGIDYSTIPDSAVIPASVATDTVFIHGLTTATGTKTVELYILSPYSCGGLPFVIDSVELTIYDSFNVHINTPDTTICVGQYVYINTSGTTGLTYSWSPATTLSSSTVLSPTATPSVNTTYNVIASLPGSGCAPSSASITISVVNPAVLNVGPPVQITCVGVPLQLGVTTTPSGTYEYNWTPATYLNNAAIANPIVTPGVAGDFEYVVDVTYPGGGCGSADSFLLHVLPNTFTLVNPDTGICYPAGTYQIVAFGDTEFTYLWTPAAGVSNPNILTPTITPEGTTTYTITASYPGCPDITHSITYTIQNPNPDIIPRDSTFCISGPVPIVVLPIDTPYSLNWSPTTDLSDPTVLSPDFFSPVPGVFTYILTITTPLGCVGSDTVTFRPEPPIRVTITPGNTTIPYGGHLQLQASSLSLNPLFYYWVPDNGTLNNTNINDPIVTPVDSVTTYMVYGMDPYGCKDSASITIHLEYQDDCIPTAFTPNGDGLNDVFKLCNSMQYEKLVDFRVLNRWGQTVFENTSDPKKGWDGTFNGVPLDMGVYNYMIIIGRPDGSNRIFKGEVTLIR